ncbi:MAG: hypothetical protein JWR61_1042 [Ferruginibacter sp.]|uniref:hypothetical protein n=1 Tax=Ferruginibacter sp. TaxID=1940288 RepID=UPI002657EBE3|nr:hypothetical protein [Ferruginibacter sp.]MDB5276087.1 hypothetical protein [Ferruginibacter sp.]
MKTTLLFSAAFLLATASFAQTSVKSQQAANNVSTLHSDKGSSEVKSAGNASSTTTVQSNAVNNTGHKVNKGVEKGKGEIAQEKQAVAAKAATEKQQVKTAASQDVTVSANTQSDVNINASEKNNKTAQNASLASQETVSTAGIKKDGNQVKESSKMAVNTTAAAAVSTGSQVKTDVQKTVVKADKKVNATAVTTVKSSSSAAHAVKPAVAVKMNTSVKTGIKIK